MTINTGNNVDKLKLQRQNGVSITGGAKPSNETTENNIFAPSNNKQQVTASGSKDNNYSNSPDDIQNQLEKYTKESSAIKSSYDSLSTKALNADTKGGTAACLTAAAGKDCKEVLLAAESGEISGDINSGNYKEAADNGNNQYENLDAKAENSVATYEDTTAKVADTTKAIDNVDKSDKNNTTSKMSAKSEDSTAAVGKSSAEANKANSNKISENANTVSMGASATTSAGGLNAQNDISQALSENKNMSAEQKEGFSQAGATIENNYNQAQSGQNQASSLAEENAKLAELHEALGNQYTESGNDQNALAQVATATITSLAADKVGQIATKTAAQVDIGKQTQKISLATQKEAQGNQQIANGTATVSAGEAALAQAEANFANAITTQDIGKSLMKSATPATVAKGEAMLARGQAEQKTAEAQKKQAEAKIKQGKQEIETGKQTVQTAQKEKQTATAAKQKATETKTTAEQKIKTIDGNTVAQTAIKTAATTAASMFLNKAENSKTKVDNSKKQEIIFNQMVQNDTMQLETARMNKADTVSKIKANDSADKISANGAQNSDANGGSGAGSNSASNPFASLSGGSNASDNLSLGKGLRGTDRAKAMGAATTGGANKTSDAKNDAAQKKKSNLG